jgi:hypothetical protein
MSNDEYEDAPIAISFSYDEKQNKYLLKTEISRERILENFSHRRECLTPPPEYIIEIAAAGRCIASAMSMFLCLLREYKPTISDRDCKEGLDALVRDAFKVKVFDDDNVKPFRRK